MENEEKMTLTKYREKIKEAYESAKKSGNPEAERLTDVMTPEEFFGWLMLTEGKLEGLELDKAATCIECGRSVAWGSGRFVNRIPFIATYQEKVVDGFAFPDGEYVCYECECKFRREDPEFVCNCCGDVNYIRNLDNGKCPNCGSTEWENVDEDNESDVAAGKLLEELLSNEQNQKE